MELLVLFCTLAGLMCFGAIISGGKVMEGVMGAPFLNAGAPVNGTSSIWTLTIDATGGTFTMSFGGFTTGAISWSATNATLVANIDAALEALTSIGTGGVTTAVGTMTAGVGTITITFAGDLGKKAVSALAVVTNSLTGTATLTVTESTPGVDATSRGAAKGRKLIDTTNGVDYINEGTGVAPSWVKTGTQS